MVNAENKRNCSCLHIALCALIVGVILLFVALVYVLYDQDKNLEKCEQSLSQKIKVVDCYECTTFVNRNESLLYELSLPEEADCEQHPKNRRRCGEREKCLKLVTEVPEIGVRRVSRRCSLTFVTQGCHQFKSVIPGEMCVCDASLCL